MISLGIWEFTEGYVHLALPLSEGFAVYAEIGETGFHLDAGQTGDLSRMLTRLATGEAARGAFEVGPGTELRARAVGGGVLVAVHVRGNDDADDDALIPRAQAVEIAEVLEPHASAR